MVDGQIINHLLIFVPNSFLPERQYIINCIFREFLGLDFEFRVHDDPGRYTIMIPGGGKLIIKDDFFSRFTESTGYLHKSSIPHSIQYFDGSLPAFADTPLLFGTTEIIKGKHTLFAGADIFASSFYMLTRWEEFVIQERDSHNRFPGTSSLAYKNNFLDRPIVNEYTDIIWELLLQTGFKGERRKRNYTVFPTHDIDHLLFWNTKTRNNLLRNIFGDLFKRKNPGLLYNRIKNCYGSYFDYNKDPYYAYDYFMDLAEEADIKANFYFMAGGQKPYDPDFYLDTSVFKNVISGIKARGHDIGIHPSYESYNRPEVLRDEINRFEKSVSIPVRSGRQHYLRFEVPDTWRIWDKCNLKIDSSMYYSGFPGFRCGTCYEFPVFDIIQRKPLPLMEMPLLMMDTCLLNHDPDYAVDAIRKVKYQVKKHNGNFVFVWHNSNTSGEPLKRFIPIFEKEFYG